MRARRNGDTWLKGEWALVEINNPSYTWISTPNTTAIESSQPNVRSPEDFYQALNSGDATTAHRLILACIEEGFVFDAKKPPSHFTDWLFNYLGSHLINPVAIDVYINMYNFDPSNPIDLTIHGDPHPSEEEALKKWMEE
jgi:hypothetical protein